MKSTSDLFNEMIPLGQLMQWSPERSPVNDSSHLDIHRTQFRILCSIGCEVLPRHSKTVLSVNPGAIDAHARPPRCKGWIERLPNLTPPDKRGVLVQLTPDGAALCEQCHQVVGQKLHQELTKNLSADEVAMLEQLLKKVLP